MASRHLRNDPCPLPAPVVGAFDDAGARDVVRPHGIAAWVLWHTQVGTCTLQTPVGELSSPAGSVVLIAPGTPHHYGSRGRWAVRWLVFTPPAAWAELLRWPQQAPGIAVCTPVNAIVGHIADAIDRAWRIASGIGPTRASLALNAVEAALLWCRSSSDHTLAADPRAQAAADAVMAQLARPHRLRGTARKVGLSAGQFARCFRASFGTSFAAWVTDRRIMRAQELLVHGESSVGMIAATVGYPDPFHFSTVFRRRCGMSPQAFRSASRKSANSADGHPAGSQSDAVAVRTVRRKDAGDTP